MARADRKLFRLLDDEVCRDLLQLLLKKGGQTQRELTEALDLSSGAISRRMTRLEDEGLAERASPRGPYRVVFAEGTQDLLRASAKLADLLAARHAGETWTLRTELEEESIDLDRLPDRAREEHA
ncbi:MAG TPA: winged helix-turn-helix domain-containing protein [Solirubrobacterales bacterium]|nr:winged helix-turn-helix domain-containing protein [Solirubrobacterales bacterium]